MRRLALLLLAALAVPALAQPSSHGVSVSVPWAQWFEVDPNPVELVFAAPTEAGDAFAPVTATSSYDITLARVKEGREYKTFKITGHLVAAYASGITLRANVSATSGLSSNGTSTGLQELPVGSANAVTLVTDIVSARGRNRPITYEASATTDADPGTHTRTVTYTVTEM